MIKPRLRPDRPQGRNLVLFILPGKLWE